MTVDETIARIRKFDADTKALRETHDCPKCGAPEATVKKDKWQCGTKKALIFLFPDSRFVGRRTKKCFEREIEALKAKLDAVKGNRELDD